MTRADGRDGEPPVSIPSSEADALVAAARGGDRDAFAALYRATVPDVFRFLYGRCGDRQLAEDLTAETCVRALRAVSRFEGSSSDFLAWLLRIARNLHLDHVKSGRVRWEEVTRSGELPVMISLGDPEQEAVATVEAERLRRALQRLTPDQQEVIYLRFFQDLPIADTARIMGRDQGAIKALQFRALSALRRILAREEGR